MNVESARQRLGHKFSNVNEVAQGVLRSIRREGGKDVAVYIFDLNDHIADNAAQLDTYLDSVLGPSYFNDEASPDLRWNHYLYLVAGRESAGGRGFQAAKRKLESDKSYARKFVIFEDEFDSTLAGIDSVAESKASSVPVDIVNVWTNRLVEAGLGVVLEMDRAIVDTVRVLSSTEPKQSTRTLKTSGEDVSKRLASSFLSSLDIAGFRPFPTRTTFDRLGKANLIFGPNGVGKTSLLEGIEFLFCGANRRSSAEHDIKVVATLETGGSVTTTSKQPPSDFKTRQLLWYGSRDKAPRNTLPNEFARFNFLNADAAAELSLLQDGDSGPRVNIERLADLLSGHEATLLWRRIEAVHRAMLDEKKRNSGELTARTAEQRAVEAEKKTLEAAPTNSDADFSILTKDLTRLGWRSIVGDKKAVSNDLIDQLSEVASRLSVTRHLGWAEGAVTPVWLAQQEISLTELVEQFRKLVEASQLAARKRAAVLAKTRRLEARELQLKSIAPEAAADLVRKAEELEHLERELTTSAEIMAAISLDAPLELDAEQRILTVAASQSQVARELADARSAVAARKLKLAEMNAKRSRLENLILQAREATRLAIEHGHSDQDCPVCGSHFEKGLLLQRIETLIVEQGASELAEVARVLESAENTERELSEREVRLERLSKFCRATGLDSTSSLVSDVLRVAQQKREEYKASIARRKSLQDAIEGYGEIGLSIERLRELCAEEDSTTDDGKGEYDVTAALQRVQSALRGQGGELSEVDSTISAQALEMELLLSMVGLDKDAGLVAGYERARDRKKAVALATEACEWVGAFISIGSRMDVLESQAAAQSAVLSAKSVASAVAREAETGKRLPAIAARLNTLGEELKRLKASLERVGSAITILEDLVSNHSLEEASRAAILTTHVVADEIFERIHTPKEYRIRTDVETPLELRDNGRVVSLREVSTGQRSAYALAIFLAMNAQVREGPKVLILDDPISHADDLNALSFLDYLRDLVLHSNRQLFFATADERVGGLFAHKFAFLDGSFRTLELSR
jgi:exonuclease SbcC